VKEALKDLYYLMKITDVVIITALLVGASFALGCHESISTLWQFLAMLVIGGILGAIWGRVCVGRDRKNKLWEGR